MKENYLRSMTTQELQEATEQLHNEVQDLLFFNRLREQAGFLRPPQEKELILNLIRSPVVRADS